MGWPHPELTTLTCQHLASKCLPHWEAQRPMGLGQWLSFLTSQYSQDLCPVCFIRDSPDPPAWVHWPLQSHGVLQATLQHTPAHGHELTHRFTRPHAHTDTHRHSATTAHACTGMTVAWNGHPGLTALGFPPTRLHSSPSAPPREHRPRPALWCELGCFTPREQDVRDLGGRGPWPMLRGVHRMPVTCCPHSP